MPLRSSIEICSSSPDHRSENGQYGHTYAREWEEADEGFFGKGLRCPLFHYYVRFTPESGRESQSG
jgi:hypothetical protein